MDSVHHIDQSDSKHNEIFLHTSSNICKFHNQNSGNLLYVCNVHFNSKMKWASIEFLIRIPISLVGPTTTRQRQPTKVWPKHFEIHAQCSKNAPIHWFGAKMTVLSFRSAGRQTTPPPYPSIVVSSWQGDEDDATINGGTGGPAQAHLKHLF